MLPLSQLIIFGKDITLLKDFYTTHFGLKIKEEIPGEWLVLQTGGIELAFHKIGAGYDEPGPFVAETNTKLVFRFDGNLVNFRNQLMKAGADMGEIKVFDGFPGQFLDGRDPEGNVFQIATAK